MFRKEIYIKRRNQLKKSLRGGVILLSGNDNSPIDTFVTHYPFIQNSIFSYYTGINKTPSVSLLIDIDNEKEILFADDYSLEDQIWTGPLPPFAESAVKTGIETVKGTSELMKEINIIRNEKRIVHYPPSCRSETLIKLSILLDKKPQDINNEASEELMRYIIFQREFKTADEIKEIESALTISYEIYLSVMKQVKPGLTEKQILGIIDMIFTVHGSYPSFPSIVTVNGHILHNQSNKNTLKSNDLLLIDTGALSNEGYCSDITRTLPVSGKFTEKQRVIYDIVLKALQTAIDSSKPGKLYKDIHIKSCKIITEGLKDAGIMKGNIDNAVEAGAHALFMPHGLGHMLGMDDHDMEVLGENNVGYDSTIKRSTQFGLSSLRFARELKVNHVVTAEPGIYFIPGLIKKWKEENKFHEFINYDELDNYLYFGGIRLENDIQINETGARILGMPIPITIEEIENIMNQNTKETL